MSDADSPSLDLLVLADLHYVERADHVCPIPSRNAGLGRELAERAVRRMVRQVRPDAIVLLGDLVDNGLAADADADLAAIRDTLAAFELPVLIVPGNHDGSAARLLSLFGDHAGLHHLGGYQLITVVAPYGEGDVSRHPDDALARVAQASSERPIVVLQHNPVYPAIDSSYPFNPTNADAVMRTYADARVLLSLSGHYHEGISPQTVDGVCYATAPALCEAPFRFLHVRLRGRQVEIGEHQLEMAADPPLWDCHCHTEYAYCRDDVTAAGAVERARLMGLAGLCITEHAGQLYLPGDDFWGTRFFDDPELIRRKRHTPECRMDAYLAQMLPLRDGFVRLGLECDSDGRGGITLLDEDREHWDLLLGAVHWIPGLNPASANDAERRRAFLAASESVARAGVDILAHPFRYFRRGRVDAPRDLYGPMARLLADAGVAAEINFHTHSPDPRFIAACLDAGVRISLATDSHALWEVGELVPHLDVLRQAGCPRDQWAAVVFRPR